MKPRIKRLSFALLTVTSVCTMPSGLMPFAGMSDTLAQGVPIIGQDIAYASGGIGTNEREELQAMTPDYSLKLEFAVEGSGAYLSSVAVSLARGDETLFQVTDVGPWLLVKLPSGSYRVVAESAGEIKEATVDVPESGLAHAVLSFPER